MSEVLSATEDQDLTTASATVVSKPVESSPLAGSEVASPAGRRLTPFLWLSGDVEDAVAFYVSVFKNSRVVGISRCPDGSHSHAWNAMTATVCLDGQDVMLLGGGSLYRPPETSQLLVRCADQAEVDYYWERLLAGGGEESAGGWLKDRFGVSWQVVPDALMELLLDPDPQRVARATEAMTKMKRVDIARLRETVSRPDAVPA
ncbi:VOC family protein [candidate division WOR-3 bacterium]|nr:VOC family protein [candidate division WOR-3 bacterium]